MKLVLAEKPSVAMSLSKVIGANQRGDGYMEGNGYIVSWCVGHLVELSQPEAYDEKYAKWRYDDLPILPELMKRTQLAESYVLQVEESRPLPLLPITTARTFGIPTNYTLENRLSIYKQESEIIREMAEKSDFVKYDMPTTFTVRGETVIVESEQLAAALLRLPEKRREVLFLRYYLGYSDTEIGRLFGVCRSTIFRRRKRSLRFIRKELEALEDEE